MRHTAKALVAGLALLMAVACAEEDETTSEAQQPVSAKASKTDKVAATSATKVAKTHWKHGSHHGKHKMDPAAHVNKMAERLGLDAAQKAKALAIFQNETLSYTERKAQLKTLLTPEQLTKLTELHSKHPHHGKMHNMDPAVHAEKLAKLAGLSDAQKSKVLALFKNEKLSWKERKAQISALMTPEQRAKVAAFKAKHHGGYGKHGKDVAKHHAEKLQEKLGITDAQKAQVQAALASGNWKELEKILSADQMEELRRLKKDHHTKWGKTPHKRQ